MSIDEIEVLYVAKRNLEELRRGAGQNQLQILHLPHPPTH
jgi:predicted DNA-binding protein